MENTELSGIRKLGATAARVRHATKGFALMSPEKRREATSKGGKAAHAKGTAHRWTSEEAQAAGRKGGTASRRRSKHNMEEE